MWLTAQVTINGAVLWYFLATRGFRHGCPRSSLLYTFELEGHAPKHVQFSGWRYLVTSTPAAVCIYVHRQTFLIFFVLDGGSLNAL